VSLDGLGRVEGDGDDLWRAVEELAGEGFIRCGPTDEAFGIAE
jgi:hypothetical protein